VARPRWRRCCSNAVAIVDLPDADRPVNHTVQPFCLRSSLRSLRVRPACHVMLLKCCQRYGNASSTDYRCAILGLWILSTHVAMFRGVVCRVSSAKISR
jgi:hypothetical protein